jgi:hypothetical protein
MKSAHELRVVQALQQAAIDYTFAELQVITDYLIGVLGKTVINTNYQLLKLPEKIKKNHLDDVEGYIAMGLASVSRVEDYINRHPDPRFAEKLTRIFVNKYISLQAEFNEPVSVFNALWDFACNDQVDYNYRSAGLSTLVYFFEKCDVFEK